MPRPEGLRLRQWPLLLAVAFACLPTASIAAHANSAPQAQLRSIENQLARGKQRQQNLAQRSASIAAEIEQIRTQQIAAAQSDQVHEAALTRLETERARLSQEIATKDAALKKHRRTEAALLSALLRLARDPPIGLALTNGKPVDLLRGGILMGGAVPALIARAKHLGIELARLKNLETQLQAAEARHRIEAAALRKEQTQLAALAAQKAALLRQTSVGAATTARQVQKLAAQARNLKDLIARAVAAERAREAAARRRREAAVRRGARHAKRESVVAAPALLDPTRPPTIRPFSEAKGHVRAPAAGEIVVSFGTASAGAETAKGITIATRPGAEVVAPYDGRVVFAGPFKGYGQILIIAHGDGYHSLVAGLDRIDCSVGQWVVAGEPVGRMPADEAKPLLYLELRHDEQPINPLPWLATRNAKAKG